MAEYFVFSNKYVRNTYMVGSLFTNFDAHLKGDKMSLVNGLSPFVPLNGIISLATSVSNVSPPHRLVLFLQFLAATSPW